MAEGRSRGRPKGYRVSAETKARIAESMRERRKKERRAPAERKDLPAATRIAVWERDGGVCCGCGEKDSTNLVTQIRDDADMGEVDGFRVLCGWCRENGEGRG